LHSLGILMPCISGGSGSGSGISYQCKFSMRSSYRGIFPFQNMFLKSPPRFPLCEILILI
jgi:hypothetical protein